MILPVQFSQFQQHIIVLLSPLSWIRLTGLTSDLLTLVLQQSVYDQHASTAQQVKHTSDLTPILKAVVQEGRTVVTIIGDGGPDWSTSSLLNALFFMRMWRECDLDILCVTSFAARYSAYNLIEHLWSPMSKRLTSVRLIVSHMSCIWNF